MPSPTTERPPASATRDLGRSTVILAAYTAERLPDIRAGLGALWAGTHRPDEVLLVIDNNAALATQARTDLAPHYPGLRVVENRGDRKSVV